MEKDKCMSLWKIIIIILFTLVILFLLGYSCFLMFKEGYKGQISFFSNIFGIILTTALTLVTTLYFTDKRLKENRRDTIDTTLYFHNRDKIYAAIGYILQLTEIINKCDMINDNLLNKSHNLFTHRKNNDSKKEMIRLAGKCINGFSKLFTQYLDPIYLDYESKISYGYKILYDDIDSFTKYYNHVAYNRGLFNKNEVVSIDSQLQNIHKVLKSLILNLKDIEKRNKRNLENK